MRDAEQERYWTCGIKETWNAGQVGCRTAWRDAGKEECKTGGIVTMHIPTSHVGTPSSSQILYRRTTPSFSPTVLLPLHHLFKGNNIILPNV